MVTPEEITEFKQDVTVNVDNQTERASIKRFKIGGYYRKLADWFTNIQAQLNLVGALFPPVYTSATAVLSSTQSPLNLEVGQTISIPLVLAFNQNDAGALISRSIQKDTVEISDQATFTDNGVVVSAVAKVYRGIVSYAQGPLKNDALGNPYPTGRIDAGSVTSNLLSYQGYYIAKLGPAAARPTNSAEARALPQSLLSNATGPQILNTGTVETRQIIISKRQIGTVIDLDAANQPVAYVEISNNFTVNDAAGVPVSGYYLYERTQGTPYGSSHRHQFSFI